MDNQPPPMKDEAGYPKRGFVSDGTGPARFDELPPELLEEQRTVSLEQGDVVGGRFEVIEPLGFGGMGAVYRVEDRELRARNAR